MAPVQNAPWHSLARVLFAALSVKLYGHRATSVAKILGKQPGSVSRWLAESDSLDHRQDLDRLDRYIMSLYQHPDEIDRGLQAKQLESEQDQR